MKMTRAISLCSHLKIDFFPSAIQFYSGILNIIFDLNKTL